MTDRLAISLHAVSVRRGGIWALRDISWRLRPGERWALLGDNGAGKTQLLKLLSGDVWPTPGGSAAPAACGPRRWTTYRVGRQPVDLIDAKRRVAYSGRRTAGQVRALRLESERARLGRDRTAPHGSAARCRSRRSRPSG